MTGAYQDHQGGGLNLEMVLCETDCELEFPDPLYFADMT